MEPKALSTGLAPGVRVRVRKANAYSDGMAGRIGTVEKVGHEVVEVRLDLTPRGSKRRIWPFDKDELEVLPRR